MHHLEDDETHGEKGLVETAQECYVLFWTNLGSELHKTVVVPPIPQTNQVDEQDMRDTHGEVKKNSDVLQWIPTLELTSFDLLARIYISSMRTLDAV